MPYDEDFDSEFADPGGNSALRAESKSNPRNKSCPTCKAKNRLTVKDVSLGYQCDSCANVAPEVLTNTILRAINKYVDLNKWNMAHAQQESERMVLTKVGQKWSQVEALVA